MNFFKTKMGMLALALALLMVAFAFYSVQQKKKARQAAASAPVAVKVEQPNPQEQKGGPLYVHTQDDRAASDRELQEQLGSSAGYRRYDSRNKEDKNRNGLVSTKRETAPKPQNIGKEQVLETPASRSPEQHAVPTRLRLSGGGGKQERHSTEVDSTVAVAKDAAPGVPAARKPQRFNPYGRPIKCELVFTIDSTMEQTPLIGLVVEPVYNNGKLVIRAGTEIHGIARPDRQRDRIFSGNEFYMVFPREEGRPNGRQLKIRGLVLDRIEPDANGMTWGITDGSYGLQGTVIRTSDTAEIKQFAATALAAVANSLQDKQTNAYGTESLKSTPRNAALQGLASSMDLMVKKIQEEIERNGVFIRVPGGHQFYFYPQQIIDPDQADISTDIAPVQ